MRVALVSGGGSKGAFGVGQAERLGNTYDVFYGWSTGALIAPLWALGRFDILKEVYFNSTNKDIFNVSPFTKSGDNDYVKGIIRTILGKPTWGETKPLKAQIDKYFTRDLWNELQWSKKEVIVGSSNIKRTNFNVEYYSSKRLCFEDFKTAMWASASPVFYGSIVELAGVQHTDAGTVEILNFKKAIEKGATYIDAIIHRTQAEDLTEYSGKVKWLPDYIGRVLPSLEDDCPVEVIELGADWARAKGCQVNLIYMPFQPDYTSFQFDPVKMRAFYNQTK